MALVEFDASNRSGEVGPWCELGERGVGNRNNLNRKRSTEGEESAQGGEETGIVVEGWCMITA